MGIVIDFNAKRAKVVAAQQAGKVESGSRYDDALGELSRWYRSVDLTQAERQRISGIYRFMLRG